MKKTAALLIAMLLLVGSCGTDSDSADETVPATTSEQQTPASAPLDELVVTVLGTMEGEGQDMTAFGPTVALPPDGLPFVVYLDLAADPDGRVVTAVKCTDAVCADEVVSTSFDAIGQVAIDVTVGPDGLPAFVLTDPPGVVSPPAVRLVRCLEPTCVDHTHTEIGTGGPPSLVVPEDDLPLLAMHGDGGPMVVKCSNPACTEHTTTELTELNDPDRAAIPWVVTARLGPDGLPVLGYTSGSTTDTGWVGDVRVLFCADPACTSIEVVTVAEEPGQIHELIGFEVGPDGPMVGFAATETPLRGPRFVRCLDPGCSQTGPVSLIGPNQPIDGAAMSVGPDGLPVFALVPPLDRLEAETARCAGAVEIARCGDPDCTEGSTAIVEERPGDLPPFIGGPVIALDEADRPTVVYQRPSHLQQPMDVVIARCADPACQHGATQTGSWDQQSSLIELEPVGEIMEGWTSVTDETVFGPYGEVGQVFEGGPGLLAFGEDCASAGECVTAVSGSVDATEWERLASVDAQQFVVTPAGPGFVAASTTCVDPDGPPGCGPVVWTSPNGTDWDQVPIDEAVFPRCAAPPDDPGGPGMTESCIGSIDHLVALPDGGLFAVGGNWSDGAVAWASTDGRDWRIVDEAFDPFDADADGFFVGGLLAAGPGLIATGFTDADELERIAVPTFGAGLLDTDGTGVEVSRIDPEGPAHDAGLEVGDLIVALDGTEVTDTYTLSWLRSTHQPGDTVTLTVVRDGDRLDLEIIYGTYEIMESFWKAAVATSIDGTQWTPVPRVLEAEGDSDFYSTRPWAGGVVATVDLCTAMGPCPNFVVTSPDGVTWQRLAGPDPKFYSDLYPFLDDGLLMVHQTSDDETGQGCTEFLTSPDGSKWTLYAADPELFPGEIGISDAIVHYERLVAVGAAWPNGQLGRPQPRVWVYEPPS